MDVSGKSLCSGYINGETRTRDLMIRFIFSRNYDFAFDMEIEIKRENIIDCDFKINLNISNLHQGTK